MATETDGWNCNTCTFKNHPAITSCELCGTVRSNVHAGSSSSSSSSSSSRAVIPVDSLQNLGKAQPGPFSSSSAAVVVDCADDTGLVVSCPSCTTFNDPEAMTCIVCSRVLKRSHRNEPEASSSTACPRCSVELDQPLASLGTCPTCNYMFKQSHQSKYKTGTTCHLCKKEGHWMKDCPFRVEDEMQAIDIATDGLIELVAANLTQQGFQKTTTEFALCSPCKHISQRGTEGYDWSCGYRNIQMISHSLLNHPTIDYRSRLFNGKGDIPDVNGIQSWIEKAWKAGFDTAGADELGHVLLGTDEWIGATECAALLRYYGIRAIVVDFAENTPRRASSSSSSSSGKLTLTQP